MRLSKLTCVLLLDIIAGVKKILQLWQKIPEPRKKYTEWIISPCCFIVVPSSNMQISSMLLNLLGQFSPKNYSIKYIYTWTGEVGLSIIIIITWSWRFIDSGIQHCSKIPMYSASSRYTEGPYVRTHFGKYKKRVCTLLIVLVI